jgi:hypothetical protein
MLRQMGASAVAVGVGIVASLAVATPAQAYCATSVEWPGSFVYAGIGNQIPAAWDPAIKASMNQWNNIPGANWTVQYTASTDVHFTVSYRIPSGGFSGNPGMTAWVWNASNKLTSANIFLNPNWTWNLNGNLNKANAVADVRTVTTHELGHELVLDHVDQCGGIATAAKLAAVMNPNYTKKWTTNADDEAGAAYMK